MRKNEKPPVQKRPLPADGPKGERIPKQSDPQFIRGDAVPTKKG